MQTNDYCNGLTDNKMDTNYKDYTPEIEYDDNPPVIAAGNPGDSAGTRPARPARRPKRTAKKPIAEEVQSGNVKSDVKALVAKIKEIATGQSLRIVVGIFLGLLGVYLLVSFISYFSTCVRDQSAVNTLPIGGVPHAANAGGEGGARLSEFLINEGFGLGSFVIVVWLMAMSLKLLAGRPKFKSVNFTIKCFIALITVSLIVGVTNVFAHSQINWGGYHAHYVCEFINGFIGEIGSVLLSLFMLAVFVVICMRDVVNWVLRKRAAVVERRRLERQAREEEEARQEEIRRMKMEEKIDDIKAGEAVELTDMEQVSDNLPELEESMKFDEGDSNLYDIGDIDSDSTTDTYNLQLKDGGQDAIGSAEADKLPDSGEADVEEEAKNDDENGEMVVHVNQIDESGKRHYKSELDFEDAHPYKFPPFDILNEGSKRISVDEEEQMHNKAEIEKTLLDYGIPIKSITATVGPTVTLYELVPENGVKIARIRSLEDDIQLRISARGVRIIAPIPGKGTVGIEVANNDPVTVSMQTVLRSRKFQESKCLLPTALGSTIQNEVYITDLAKMPHLLVAGATGQGKSVGLNAIIASLLYSKSPSQLKFVMIDPKMVEFSLYNKIKKYYMAVIPEDEDTDQPVITSMEKVQATLSSLCVEMDNRYKLLMKAEVRNIEEYNAKVRDGRLSELDGHKFLPYIVVIVDEFGDLVMVAGKAVELPIARLAQKARAVGMHVIIATQRPSTNVITGIIKANFPARISFRVSSGVDSKTILDTPGAQHLIGRGDMLISNNSEIVRVQCAFIDTPEVANICEYISRQPYAPGVYLLPEPADIAGTDEGGGKTRTIAGASTEKDPYFDEVARRVVNTNTASTSQIQRVFSLGYNRAGRIMDQLEAAGIVGPASGGKPRSVLVDMATLESILESI